MWISIGIVCIPRSCTDRRRSCKIFSRFRDFFRADFGCARRNFTKKGLSRDSWECFLVLSLPLLRFLWLCFLQKSSSMGHAIHKIKQAPLVVINVGYELWRVQFLSCMLYRQKDFQNLFVHCLKNRLPVQVSPVRLSASVKWLIFIQAPFNLGPSIRDATKSDIILWMKVATWNIVWTIKLQFTKKS